MGLFLAYSWLYTEGSFLEGSEDPMKCQESNQGQSRAKQVPYHLYYCSSPIEEKKLNDSGSSLPA